MTDLERDAMLRAVHQAVLGIPGTNEKGLVGKVDNINKTVDSVCEDQNKLKRLVYSLIALLAGAGILTGASLSHLIKVG